MNSFFSDFFTYLPDLLEGLRISLLLTATSLTIGLPAALLLALGVESRLKFVRWTSAFFIEVGRGAPALVLLQLAYYGLPGVGLTLTSFVASMVALAWTTAGYCAEYLRGGLAAVPNGVVEGAAAAGMSARDTLRFIVLPQGLRISIPALMGFAVMLFQATSLAYAVAVPELMSRAYSIGSANFRYLNILVAAGIIYAAISIPSTWLSVLVERRLSRHLR